MPYSTLCYLAIILLIGLAGCRPHAPQDKQQPAIMKTSEEKVQTYPLTRKGDHYFYTTLQQLAISGGSNGGLLVGAAITQQPDLFAAALPRVGVMDMLRHHQFTLGWAWVGEFGSSDDPQQFKTLLEYSPLHKIEPGTRYPATMIMTADHDDRVVPAHSHKFAATLQAAQKKGGPVVLARIETKAGHGAGKPISKRIEEATDSLAFLLEILHVDNNNLPTNNTDKK